MSLITSPVITDATGQEIVSKLHTQNMLLDVIAGAQLEHTDNLDEIHAIVASGKAADVFSIGDQIIVPWTDVAANKTYSMPFDVVHIPETVTLADGEQVPGMVIQMHYALPFGVQFSAPNAMQYYENGLSAGTYYFIVGAAYGDVAADTAFKFTLTQDIPAGGQLAAAMRSDADPSNWKVSTYASKAATAAIETVAVSSGVGGTLIGTLLNTNSGALNLARVGWGNNRYRDSAMRQFLNSTAGVGAWWTPQHDYDRAPDQLLTKGGLLSGFEDDFLSIIKATKIQVSANTVSDGGDTDVMYDKFFLPSLEEMHWTPQASGIEGEAWEYWKQASGSSTPLPTGAENVFPNMRTFALENKNSAQTVRLRSATRGITGTAWYVSSTGYANGYGALHASRPAAACVIC